MDRDERIVYVENFVLNTTETKLSNLFKNFGKVKQIDLPTFDNEHPLNKGLPRPKCKGYAFIEFQTADEASRVCEFYNDLNIILERDTSEAKSNIESYSLAEIQKKVFENLEFKDLLSLRVMPKVKHVELTRRYNNQRFQSMVRAAKFLVVA